MSDVTVIGLGRMGSALTRAFRQDGHDLTVWNRTSSKAEPLVSEGATLAPDPASAVGASLVVVVCVSDYEAGRDILSGPEVAQQLSGRVLVQLSSGTPQEARELERWAAKNGAEYLDGTIEVYPEQIGTPEAGIRVAGAESAVRRHESLLRSLAGDLSHVGEEVGAANALGLALGAVLFGSLLGALHGARMWEIEGLRLEEYASRLAEFMPTVGEAVRDLAERIQEERYDDSQATLQIGAGGAQLILQQARDSQIDSDFPAYAAGALRKGISAGLGSEDMAALIEVLRRNEHHPHSQTNRREQPMSKAVTDERSQDG